MEIKIIGELKEIADLVLEIQDRQETKAIKLNSSNESTDGIRLIKTSEMFPEQYDAIDSSNNKIGYLRLRFGYFAVYCPDETSDTPIYSFRYDNSVGSFPSDNERKRQLIQAKLAISAWYNSLK